jgi:Asp-tRNA(Asn)/Glu-tRNA(Gln) amidotransferase C subunit
MPRDPLPETELDMLARFVKLELTPERKAALGPALDGVLMQFDALDDVDPGETPPTNSFDPRWRR